MKPEKTSHKVHPLSILLVEDDPNDVFVFQSAVASLPAKHHVAVASDADAALEILRREPANESVIIPSLVILDINLPGMSGLELLAEIRALPHHRTTSVIVMSTSRTEREVEEAYALGATFYVAKPFDFSAHMQVARDIISFWSTIVRLPRRVRRAGLPDEQTTPSP